MTASNRGSSSHLDTLLKTTHPGDPDLLEMLMRKYYAPIYRLALTILDDQSEADDAAQETFIKASQKIDSFRGDAHIKTQLYRIGVNICRSRLRKRKVRENLRKAIQSILPVFDRSINPEVGFLKDERDFLLWQAINTLDEKHRLPLILYYVENLPAHAIANILKIPQGTIYSRLHYARNILRARLSYDNLDFSSPDTGHPQIYGERS